MVTAGIDAGAGPTLIREDFLSPNWRNAVRTTIKLPRLKSTSGKALKMNGTIFLYVKMRDNIARMWFGVINGLEVNILLGTSYIDSSIWYLLPMKRRIISVHFTPVKIISVIKDEEYVQWVLAVSVEQASKDPRSQGRIPDELAKTI